MKKLLPIIATTITALFLVSCFPPAPVHVHEVNVVKVPTKKTTSKPKPKKVYVTPKDTAESFRAVSH